MSQHALVQKVAASTPAANTGPCTTCPTAGLPILLTRYAIVPKALKSLSLSGECNSPYLATADAGKVKLSEVHYALQTLRAGFVYLYYEVPDSKQWQWFCYMVSPQGMLRQVQLGTDGPVEPEVIACTREGHNVKAAIIALEKPEKITKAYFAYSEYFWSKKTLDRYGQAITGGSKAPYIGKERFVEFSPATWMTSLKQPGAMTHALGHNQIAEYYQSDLTREFDGSHFVFSPRKDQYLGLRKHMDAMNAGKGVVIALPDPVGYATELNTFRLQAYKEQVEYASNPDVIWKHRTAIQIEGLRELMKKQAEKEVEAEAKKPHQYNPRRGPQQSKDAKIASETASKNSDLESHYDEGARQAFLADFKRHVDDKQKIIEALDADYCALMESESLSYVMGDSSGEFWDGAAYAEISDRIHAGGAITEKSRALWKTILEREATDFKNYAIRGILLNQEKWLQAFKSGDEKTIGEYFQDQGTISKLYDKFKNGIESKGGQILVEKFGDKINQYGSGLLNTITGAICAVTKDLTESTAAKFSEAGKEVQEAISKATAHLDRLQVKLGLAYAHIAAESSVVLLKIELTVDEWHQVIMSEITRTLRENTKEVSKKLAVLALSAQLRVPPGSAMANQLIEFTFWVIGKGDQFVKNLAAALGTTADALLGAGGQTVKTGTAMVRATGEGARNAVRKVVVLGHNLKRGAQVLARIPRQVAASEAMLAAGRLTRNSFNLVKSPDVSLATIAFGFQVYSLYKALDDYGKNAGWKQRDAMWSIGSSSLGIASAAFDIYGKGAIVLGGKEARVFGGRVAASTLVRWAGIAGAGVSFVESVQASVRSSTFFKRGDNDAARYHALTAAAAFGAGVFGVQIALGATAFFGPVGLLIACIGLGLLFTYMAFMAEDKPVQIWLDRSSFGHHKRSEGPFRSLQQEMDGLELIARQVVVELEWHDTIANLATDQISVLVKRPANAGDGVLYGLIVKGRYGQVLTKPWTQGLGDASGYPWPPALANSKESVAIQSDVKRLDKESTSSVIEGATPDSKVVAVEEWWEVNTTLFDAADIHIRYFPSINNKDEYFDDVMRVED